MLTRAAHPGIVETVPTYRSLIVHYDPRLLPPAELESIARRADEALAQVTLPLSRVIEVPTLYGGESGPDLADVAAHAGLSADDAVAAHTGADYLVYMIGFMPGFPYLGGLSPRLGMPRLGTPRTRVPAGSVGIAGHQTGIYPTASPGGWRLIGRTPLRLFDVARTPPAILQAGDYVRFVSVTADAYREIQAQVEAGNHVPVVVARR
jgi:KipI family sensor histidine kinase inhibitor